MVNKQRFDEKSPLFVFYLIFVFDDNTLKAVPLSDHCPHSNTFQIHHYQLKPNYYRNSHIIGKCIVNVNIQI